MSLKAHLKRLSGQPVPHAFPVGLAALERDWSFRPSRPNPLVIARRMRAWFRRGAAPAWSMIRPVTPRNRWVAYFVYLPDGMLTSAHRYTLERLHAAEDTGLLVVCACPASVPVPPELSAIADALYWKDLGGYDFSAFAIAIRETARLSPGADLLLQNDSVFGPLVPVDRLWPMLKWDFSGFTGSSAVQNHLQSYAFALRAVDDRRVAALSTIFPPTIAFDDYEAILLRQETRMATVAARSMSVGSLWYARAESCADASLFAALPLVDAGFPFLKRALLTKHAGIYPRDVILETLRRAGHPAP